MNFGNVLIESFLSGDLKSKDFILSCLDKKTSLSKFLYKELSKKNFKIDVKKLKEVGKAKIIFGKKTEWWLYTKNSIKDIDKEKLDYRLPICNNEFFIVAYRRKENVR